MPWTHGDDMALTNTVGYVPTKLIAESLNKSETSVYERIKELRLRDLRQQRIEEQRRVTQDWMQQHLLKIGFSHQDIESVRESDDRLRFSMKAVVAVVLSRAGFDNNEVAVFVGDSTSNIIRLLTRFKA